MLRPFSRFCVRIGAVPPSIIKSLSYEEQLIRLVKFLKEQVVPAIDENANAIEELQGSMIELENYVNDYFDNLDVQEEINNKLDDMVEQGTLQEIIADYLNSKAVFGFDSVSDMKSATNLINGSYAETLGYYSKNDGGSALYKVRTITNDDIVDEASIIALADDSLIAELIVKDSIINAKQFGVYGNNTNDDTTNLQKAITYCETNDYKLYIPKGDYLISDTLNVTGISISGESSTSTTLHLDNCDGLLLKQYNKQNICVIENIAIKSDDANIEIAGITYQAYDHSTTTRSRGYKLTNLYFYNLGCGIEMQDAFRNTVVDIGMNNCFRAVLLKEQVVQCSFYNIVANNDLDPDLVSTRFGDTRNSGKSIGFQIGVAGEEKRPEGIKLSQVCCTNYNVGCYEYNSLFFTANQCEFDLCQNQGVIVYAGSGITFNECWIANKDGATNPIVDLLVSNTTAKSNIISILNCTVFNQTTENDVVGISVGSNNQYGYGYVIKGNTIMNATNCALKVGILFNRCRESLIDGNNVHGCSEYDIRVYNDGVGNRLINNVTEILRVAIYENQKLYAINNIYTSKEIANNGTLIGNFD